MPPARNGPSTRRGGNPFRDVTDTPRPASAGSIMPTGRVVNEPRAASTVFLFPSAAIGANIRRQSPDSPQSRVPPRGRRGPVILIEPFSRTTSAPRAAATPRPATASSQSDGRTISDAPSARAAAAVARIMALLAGGAWTRPLILEGLIQFVLDPPGDVDRASGSGVDDEIGDGRIERDPAGERPPLRLELPPWVEHRPRRRIDARKCRRLLRPNPDHAAGPGEGF